MPSPDLLAHVLGGNCTDPDCEIHHIEVGLSENTIQDGDLAFWLAGFEQGIRSALAALPDAARVRQDAIEELLHGFMGHG